MLVYSRRRQGSRQNCIRIDRGFGGIHDVPGRRFRLELYGTNRLLGSDPLSGVPPHEQGSKQKALGRGLQLQKQ